MSNRIDSDMDRSRIQVASADASDGDTTDVLASVWRYRWAVILPGFAGLAVGLLLFLRSTETFRSTTRLMVESDRPAMLEPMSGDVYGGVPAIEIVESQLLSDEVVKIAFKSPAMEPFQDRFQNNVDVFNQVVQRSLVIEPEVEDLRTAQSLVTLLHFDSPDRELCRVAVDAFSKALQEHFNNRQRNSRDELNKLIRAATDELYPKLLDLEEQYSEFRKDAQLAWDTNGNAINPFRERQLFLIGKRSELTERLRQAEIELKSVQSIVQQSSKDPLLALNIVGQLLDKRFVIPDGKDVDLRQGDNELAQIELDQELVPLMIERNKYEAEYGPNHPTVKALDAELLTMKNELKRLVEEKTNRIVELQTSALSRRADPIEQAKEAVKTIIQAGRAEVEVLKSRLAEIDGQIQDEKLEAARLASQEQDNRKYLRKIERTRELLDQLEQQMARVDLMEEESGTRVVELTKPSAAYRTAPNLVRYLAFGSLVGLALGVGLALLLEKNANTFRDPDEIAHMLGVPVLTHVPFFRKKGNRGRGDQDAYRDIDPGMAVLHMPASVAAEAIRSLRTSVFFETSGKGGKIIQVTSPLPGDGKTTIAGNLACSIAQSGKRVLAIDCDLRRPQLTDNFSMEDKVGLTNLLNGECDPTEATHCTPVPTLHVIPSGPIPANPAEALTLPDMGDLLEMFREQYDYVIVDTPPLLVVTDPGIVASLVDAVVLSIRIRRKSKPNAKESINILRAVGANVLGIVINNSDDVAASDGYRGYGYYRYGRYSKRYNVKDSNGLVTPKLGSSQVVVSGGASDRIRQARTIDVKAMVNTSPESTTMRQVSESTASVD